ncbi:cell wall-active antibiotics response protein [Anaerobacillus sp. CMMVII]|uniref:cell wall-active antibiotics response protein LiaF n=1 Tax=Anaerobacillus sp. CMMVII TaxID=2755588 RepID=UPI0021B7FE95|nr:cell wall-active antibiotics response protein LiaF [Anaerobacillus sp. CMMVII]MCT8140408.1 cell wall-active antibiotics response protein [Anaerobacillus sp. CMMVII]
MAKKMIGLLIFAVGVLFLLTNVGVIEMTMVTFFSTYWPVLIIYFGLRQVLRGLIYFTRKLRDGMWRVNKLFWGLLILAIGIILQGNKLDIFAISAGQFWSWTWPILIIYFGLSIIFNRRSDLIVVDLSGKDAADMEDVLTKKRKGISNFNSRKTLIGDIRLGKTPWQIEELQTWVGIGDISVDLSTAMLEDGENLINLSGGIGDIKILVPDNLPVKINVDVKLGDVKVFENKQSGTNRFVSYVSENYALANKKVAIYVQLSIGDVKVKRVD